jgi:hypothetical protein
MINYDTDLQAWDALYKSITNPFGNSEYEPFYLKSKHFTDVIHPSNSLEVTISPKAQRDSNKMINYQRVAKLVNNGKLLKQELFTNPTYENQMLFSILQHASEKLKKLLEALTSFYKESYGLLSPYIKHLLEKNNSLPNTRKITRRSSQPHIQVDHFMVYPKSHLIRFRRCRSCICSDCGGQNYNRRVQMKLIFLPLYHPPRITHKSSYITACYTNSSVSLAHAKQQNAFTLKSYFKSNREKPKISHFAKALTPPPYEKEFKIPQSSSIKAKQSAIKKIAKVKLPPLQQIVRYQAVGDIVSRRFWMYKAKKPPSIVKINVS